MGLTGGDKHVRRLRRLSTDALKVASAVVYEGADMIRADAFQKISAGSVSGRNHVASAPGDYPNRDTGNLQAHLTIKKTGQLTAEVRSEAKYAAALEFGTSKMAARPYMRPSRDAKRKDIEKRLAEQMSIVIKRSG